MPQLNSFIGPIASAVTVTTGIGADILYSATRSCVVSDIIFNSAGTNSAATVARIFLSTGDSSVAENNALIADITLPAVTISQTSALTPTILALDMPLEENQKLLVALGNASSPGWYVGCRIEVP